MTTLTRKPVHDGPVRFHVVVGGHPHDYQKKLCGIHDLAIRVQRFTLMLLLVRKDNLGEAIGSLLGIREFSAKISNTLLETRYFFP